LTAVRVASLVLALPPGSISPSPEKPSNVRDMVRCLVNERMRLCMRGTIRRISFIVAVTGVAACGGKVRAWRAD